MNTANVRVKTSGYLEGNKLIHFYDHQTGFLSQHFTVTQLCYLTQRSNGPWSDRSATGVPRLSKAHGRSRSTYCPSFTMAAFSALAIVHVEMDGTFFLSFFLSFLQIVGTVVGVYLTLQGNMDSGWAMPSSSSSCGIPRGTFLGPTFVPVFINDLVSKPSNFADRAVYSHGNNRLGHM